MREEREARSRHRAAPHLAGVEPLGDGLAGRVGNGGVEDARHAGHGHAAVDQLRVHHPAAGLLVVGQAQRVCGGERGARGKGMGPWGRSACSAACCCGGQPAAASMAGLAPWGTPAQSTPRRRSSASDPAPASGCPSNAQAPLTEAVIACKGQAESAVSAVHAWLGAVGRGAVPHKSTFEEPTPPNPSRGVLPCRPAPPSAAPPLTGQAAVQVGGDGLIVARVPDGAVGGHHHAAPATARTRGRAREARRTRHGAHRAPEGLQSSVPIPERCGGPCTKPGTCSEPAPPGAPAAGGPLSGAPISHTPAPAAAAPPLSA